MAAKKKPKKPEIKPEHMDPQVHKQQGTFNRAGAPPHVLGFTEKVSGKKGNKTSMPRGIGRGRSGGRGR